MQQNSDGVMKPETLRELGEGEEPKPEEIVWNIGDPIMNYDQAAIAKAVDKRLRKAGKHWSDVDRCQIAQALEEFDPS